MSRVLGENWALPALDHLNRSFFTSGQLILQQCGKCGHFQHPPEDICRSCQSFEVRNFASKGEGRIESVVVAYHPVHPGLADHVPYAIVAVSLDDAPGVLVIGNATGKPHEAFAIGDRVRVVMEIVDDRENGQRLFIPQWEAAG